LTMPRIYVFERIFGQFCSGQLERLPFEAAKGICNQKHSLVMNWMAG